MTAVEIRQAFLDFFKSKEHAIVPSAPIVIKNDPTLLFTNAGMNQFKDYFLGNRVAEHKRIADTQKCLRVSGKHNDLEEVGVDTYHHTMFEMLGNWSFGDYFKKDALAWSWELLTDVLKIDKNRIYVTVFEGDEKEQLPFDQDAFDEWKKWIAEDRILKGNKKDNFWEMGDTGPCGPCSEIHVDCRTDEERAAVDGKTLVNNDHPQVIEIWNNVFMEFNRLKNGTLEPLPAKHVDTGMGFERLVRVLQKKTSNYDTDIFTPTINITEQIVDKKYTGSDTKMDISFRVLADHIRAIAFTIADGQLPSNTGAGYVIRRILRRAVRYYYSYLDYKQPLLFQLIPHVAAQFEQVFPELFLQKDFVAKVIREEEDAFLRTLEKGIKRFDDYYSNAVVNFKGQEDISESIIGTTTQDIIHRLEEQRKGHVLIDGKFAFELYDTYGFPLDLTALMAQEVGATVDENGFAAEMAQQKARSRQATVIDTEDWVTVNNSDELIFTGYQHLNEETVVVRYRKIKAKGKEQYQIVLQKTPFYAESGGQIGDTGVLIFGEEIIEVTDTKKENNVIIHFTNKLPTNIESKVVAKVDWARREAITYNHTATHLMHAALREVLGTHVAQKGSMVAPDVLRFDFSHFSKMTDEEVVKVEDIVNDKIRANIPVVIKEMPKDEALGLGAMALFGEKYGDVVRVVIIDPKYSVELCGGTHVANTGNIGVFCITSESAVAAGVRRIEALTGAGAFDYLRNRSHQIKAIAELLKSKDALKSVEKLLSDKSVLEKQVEQLEMQQIDAMTATLSAQAVSIQNSINFIGTSVNVNSMDALRKLANDLRNRLDNSVVVVCTEINGKAQVAIGVHDTLTKEQNIDAGKLIKEIVSPLINGGGGGQKTLATAGGQNVAVFNEVIEKIKSTL